MAISNQPLTVPLFTLDEIRLAHLCAIKLWEGIDFQKNKETELTDEELLSKFSIGIQRGISNPTVNQFIEEDIRDLIRVLSMKVIYRNRYKIDFQGGIDAINAEVIPVYLNYLGNTGILNSIDCATAAVLNLGTKFVDQTNAKMPWGRSRASLAVRILFFALPDMMVFNFSKKLSHAMKFPAPTQRAIPEFNKILADGLILNDAFLTRCPMPSPKVLSPNTWQIANNNGWWKRRVLDIACLNYFKVTIPHADFVKMANNGIPII